MKDCEPTPDDMTHNKPRSKDYYLGVGMAIASILHRAGEYRCTARELRIGTERQVSLAIADELEETAARLRHHAKDEVLPIHIKENLTMGDRTWLRLSILPRHVARVIERLGKPETQSSVEGFVHLFYSEVNYGGNYLLHYGDDALCRTNIPFAGSHGAGANYPPYVFVCVDGEYAECTAFEDGEDPCVRVIQRFDGKIVPAPEHFKEAKLYLELKALFDTLTGARFDASTSGKSSEEADE